jgi:hypothetical protein
MEAEFFDDLVEEQPQRFEVFERVGTAFVSVDEPLGSDEHGAARG